MRQHVEGNLLIFSVSDQIRSVAQSCPTLCDPMNRSMPGLPVHHQLPEVAQTHVHQVSEKATPLALFIEMLPKAHWTSPSRMSASR